MLAPSTSANGDSQKKGASVANSRMDPILEDVPRPTEPSFLSTHRSTVLDRYVPVQCRMRLTLLHRHHQRTFLFQGCTCPACPACRRAHRRPSPSADKPMHSSAAIRRLREQWDLMRHKTPTRMRPRMFRQRQGSFAPLDLQLPRRFSCHRLGVPNFRLDAQARVKCCPLNLQVRRCDRD
ncbi:hypothetical protein EDB86DRAFT_1860070 [Lactarius hatsudake]|nr:hypothetical protein EDB86DRAFT_1860070 [Lactarius hatsudake]